MEFLISYYSYIFLFFCIMILFGFLNSLVQRQSNIYIFNTFGYFGIYITSIIGTTIHELSHAIFVALFGNQFKDIKLFPTPNDIKNGKPLGYVSYMVPQNFLGKISLFFISIGPMLGCPLIILVLMKILLPSIFVNIYDIINLNLSSNQVNIILLLFNILGAFFKGVFSLEIISSYKFYLFLFLAGSIACHVTLSWADIKGALKGFIYILLTLIMIGFIGFILKDFQIKLLSIFCFSCSFFSMLFIISFIFGLIILVINYLLFILTRAF